MRARPTALTAAALAATAALTLSACGGGSGDGDSTISPTPPATTASTAPPTTAATPAGEPLTIDPALTLPADLKLNFDWQQPSDHTQAIALVTAANFMQSVIHGVVKQNPKDSGLVTYSAGDARTFGTDYVQQYIDHKWTVTGTDHYYDPKVDVTSSKASAQVTFCENQSKIFSKDIKTGKVFTTPESDSSYVSYAIVVAKLPLPTELWQAESITVKEKALECKQ
jgi:hypothetical protein